MNTSWQNKNCQVRKISGSGRMYGAINIYGFTLSVRGETKENLSSQPLD